VSEPPVTTPAVPTPSTPPDGASDRIALDGFPRGARAGDFFHAVLEVVDFQNAGDEELFDAANEKFEQFGFARGLSPETRDALLSSAVRALRETLTTPLAAASGVRLADLPLGRRLSELEFRVPVAANGEPLTPQHLAAAFRAHPSPELLPSYADRVERLAFPSLRGFLKGYIDLVFMHEDRWYVVDYKTNHLGDFASDYHAARMGEEMAYLQYHLYTLAVERLIRRFVRDYSYERHFGGVFYLFMKGMRPGAPGGVFFEKPPLARLEALSLALGGTRARTLGETLGRRGARA
jgi:exodeoxyribonuclease V beta subunit